MRLNRMTDYGVVVLCQMARQGCDGPFTAPCLAEATGLPLPSVAKLLKTLAQSGLVRAHRGSCGGYVLARAPEAISALDIVLALDGPVELTACVDGSDQECGFEASCPIKGHWTPVNLAVRLALAGVSLAEMAGPRPACGVEGALHGMLE